MVNLKTFLINPFTLTRTGNDGFEVFAQDHLARLKANNTAHQYDAYIAKTTEALQVFIAAKQAVSYHTAQKEGGTISVNQWADKFLKMVLQNEGFVKGIWGNDSATYQAFYPHGLKEYHRATRANLNELMDRYLQVANTYADDLPAGFASSFAEVIAHYKASRKTQLSLMGMISGERQKVVVSRKSLADQLMLNLLKIAELNFGNPKVVSVFFTQHYISRNKPQAKEDNLHKGSIEPSQSIELWYDSFDTTTAFTFRNTGKTRLQFYTLEDPQDTVPEDAFEVQAGETATAYAFELGDADNLYLMVHNPNVELAGTYEVSR